MKMIRNGRKTITINTGAYYKTEENAYAPVRRKFSLGEEKNIARMSLSEKTGINSMLFSGPEFI